MYFGVFSKRWLKILGFLIVCLCVGYVLLLKSRTFEPFTPSFMQANIIDETIYHPTDTDIVSTDAYLRKIITGKNTTYSSLVNPMYLYADSLTNPNRSATTYTGLPDSARYSSSPTNYVPNYTDSITLSRTRG